MFHVEHRQAVGGVGDRQFESLSFVAHVERALELYPARPLLCFEVRKSQCFQPLEFNLEAGMRKNAFRAKQESSRVMLDDVASQNADSGERAWHGWNHDPRNLEFRCEVASMQCSCASEGDKGKVTGVVSFFNRNHAHRFFHVSVHHAHNSFGKLLYGVAGVGVTKPIAGKPAGSLKIKLETSAEKLV